MSVVRQIRDRVASRWRTQDTISKWLIAISLLFIFFAYQPTLQFNYVTQDQWRVFRYSTPARTAAFRAEACIQMLPPFYILTGRPLVWPSECVEDAAVARKSDFFYLRPIVLSIVIITALYFGAVIAPIVGGWAMGVMAASVFLMAPGYSFMYLQGMTAAAVLLTVILAAASFSGLRRVFDQKLNGEVPRLSGYFFAFLWFFLGCLIYPAWEFLVVTLALAEFGFDVAHSLRARFKRLFSYLLFYAFSALAYYIFVKLSSRILLLVIGSFPDIADYTVSLQLSPEAIWERSMEAWKYFYAMAPSNFNAPHGLPIILTVLFSLNAGFQHHLREKAGLLSSAGVSVLVFAISSVVLVGSISPWLFSRFHGIGPRFVIPWYLFFSLLSAGLLFSIAKYFSVAGRNLCLIAVMIVGVVPIAIMQNKVSFLQVVVSDYEIWSMGLRLDSWLDKKADVNGKLTASRYLLVILPRVSMPAFVEDLLQGGTNLENNAVLASSRNPASIPWMINALLRQRPEAAKSIKIVDCAFSQQCVFESLADSSNVVLGMTYGEAPIKTTEKPFIINLSDLTSKPMHPVIDVDRWMFPTVSASSQFEAYGPQGLLWSVEPGWHAALPVEYPQSVTIDFHRPKEIRQISLHPQDGLPARAPKIVQIEASDNGKDWQVYDKIDIGCFKTSKWHDIDLGTPIEAQYLKLNILANCGDSILTIRGLKFE